MNCPVRTDPLPDEGHNQNPPAFAAELTTNNSLNHRANDTKTGSASRIDLTDGSHDSIDPNSLQPEADEEKEQEVAEKKDATDVQEAPTSSNGSPGENNQRKTFKGATLATMLKVRRVLVKYAKFVGPGIMISVAYIDPGMPSIESI